jgi:rhodanese-related sulfurtransferase
MNFLSKIFSGGTVSISAEEAHQQLNSANPPFLLDVRTSAEFKEAHVQGAKLIPLNELPTRMSELPKNRTILVMCRSGARSSAAAGQLASAGFNVINLSGGISAWMQHRYPVISKR